MVVFRSELLAQGTVRSAIHFGLARCFVAKLVRPSGRTADGRSARPGDNTVFTPLEIRWFPAQAKFPCEVWWFLRLEGQAGGIAKSAPSRRSLAGT